jgi:hypothetical protein
LKSAELEVLFWFKCAQIWVYDAFLCFKSIFGKISRKKKFWIFFFGPLKNFENLPLFWTTFSKRYLYIPAVQSVGVPFLRSRAFLTLQTLYQNLSTGFRKLKNIYSDLEQFKTRMLKCPYQNLWCQKVDFSTFWQVHSLSSFICRASSLGVW